MRAVLQAAVTGVFSGGLYALVGVSITVMFRSTGVLSFAHAAFAMVAAYCYSSLAGQGWPVGLAAGAAIGISVVIALAVERFAIRPVAEAPPMTRLMSTLGILLTTQGVVLALFGFNPRSAPQLLPARFVRIFGVAVVYQQIAILTLAIALTGLLGVVLQRTRLGMAVRAAAQDVTVARLLGVRPGTVARFNWGLGGLLSAIVGVFVAPLSGVSVATFPLLLVKSLASTLFGGLVSIPATFLGGLAVGAAESIAVVKSNQPGIQELTVLLLMVVLLLARRSWPAEFAEEAGVVRTKRVRTELPGQLASVFVFGTMIVFLGMAVFSEYWSFIVSQAAVFAMAGLALVILTGWAGQPSIMHAAFMGLGAFSTFTFANRFELPIPLAVLLGAVSGMLLGGLVALPALRLRGLQLAVVSLAVAGAVGEWLVQLRTIRLILLRPQVGPFNLGNDRVLALFIVSIAAVSFLAAWNLRRSTWGALLLATRHRQGAVAQFGVNPTTVKLAAFLMSGLIAAMAGSLWGILITRFGSAEVGIQASIRLLLATVIGGIGSLAGPIIAVLQFNVAPQFLPSYRVATAIPDIVAGLLVVINLASFPGGLASGLRRPRLPVAVRWPTRVEPVQAVLGALRRRPAAEPEVSGATP